MPSFTLDIYKDFTYEQLKTRCRELNRTVGKYGLIIAVMADNEEALKLLSEEKRQIAINLNKGYKDD